MVLNEVQRQSMDSASFPQYASVGFTATAISQNGTITVNGVFGELLNPTTKVRAFLTFATAGPDVYAQAVPDYVSMVQSILWPR